MLFCRVGHVPFEFGKGNGIGSVKHTTEPRVERRGIEPRFSACKTDVFPLDQRPVVI